MTNEDYVSYEIAQALARCDYDGQCDYMYATENFCYGNNPYQFDTVSAGERVLECVAYYVNDNNEDAYRGIPCPSLWQAQKWLRDTKGIAINVIAHDGGKYHWSEVFLPNFREKGYKWFDYRAHPFFPTYESALSDGIAAALKLIDT